MKKESKGLADPAQVEPEVQLRVLDFFNNHHRPADFKPKLGELYDEDVVCGILDAREKAGAFGFRSLQDLIALPVVKAPFWAEILKLFGPLFYGKWIRPYATVDPNTGLDYHVAHAVVLKNGKVIFLPEANTAETLIWDPSDEVNPLFSLPANAPGDFLFCSGHCVLPDGRLFAVGGGGGGPAGVNRAWLYDPDHAGATPWRQATGNMTHARWYPTAVMLGDGKRVMVVGGYPAIDSSELFDIASQSFSMITGAKSLKSFPQLYPGLHLLPGGEIYYTRTGFASGGAGPGGILDPDPANYYFKFTGASSGEWVPLDGMMEHRSRERGMSVLMLNHCHPTGAQILVGGGTGLPGSETSELSNVSTLNPVWEHPMLIPGGEARSNVNAVLLPDGQVFLCGGTSTANSVSAAFHPDHHHWHSLARTQYRKQYHSVAVLLPSGKVAATGGSNYGGGSNVIEIYSPPYLFRGARPVISGVPTDIFRNVNFFVDSPQATDIAQIVLVRPMAVTHQTDTEQRVVSLQFRLSGARLRVTPPNPEYPHNVAPPGYYMMFILNDRGVPSVAKFVRLR